MQGYGWPLGWAESYERRSEHTMTLAIDRKTRAVVGQVVFIEQGPPTWPSVHVLTKDGYKILSAASVRLEKVQ